VPDTSPDDAADLTALLSDYGGLWQITKTQHGYTATRRPPPPAPPAVFTAETIAALRELLEYGYDTRKLAGVQRDFGSRWEIEHLDPGSAWVAVSHDGDTCHVLAASDLDSLRSKLGRAPQ
jgi:hypothetical protein